MKKEKTTTILSSRQAGMLRAASSKESLRDHLFVSYDAGIHVFVHVCLFTGDLRFIYSRYISSFLPESRPPHL